MSKSFSIISSPYAFIATLFGVGAIPFASGTWGSFVALLAYLFITIYFGLSLLDVILITLIVVFLSVWICEKATAGLRDEDKDVKSIVIDEFSGLWIACIPASSFLMVREVLIFSLIAFILFRIFDIWKPYPINKLDEKFKNGFGIVADDVMAGVYAATFTSLIFYLLVR